MNKNLHKKMGSLTINNVLCNFSFEEKSMKQKEEYSETLYSEISHIILENEKLK